MSRTILIVDDVKVNRLILGELLKRDYNVLEAEDGEQALNILRREGGNVSAVLLDIIMPVMDGFETLRQMKDDPLLSKIPVIMITGSEDEVSRVLSLSEGASDYVTKPYNPEIIRHCLHNHISFAESSATVFALQRDKLTGLYNRDAFFEKAAELLAENPDEQFVLACLDVDSFKTVNEMYGSEKGDDVIRTIAEFLRESRVKSGGISGRIAADYFVSLFLNNADSVNKVKPEEVERSVRAKTGVEVKVSVGRYTVVDRAIPLNAMYDRAKMAQRSVKGHFGNRMAFYDEKLGDEFLQAQALVTEMKGALAGNQFEVWYQPQHNHATGDRIGAEALVRWRHPEKGLIPPSVFIPLFEKNGFVYELDRFVWERVCSDLREWLDAGYAPMPISVNVSRYDILMPDLVQFLASLTEKYSVPRNLLQLEITESAFVDSIGDIVTVVEHLISYGFTIEIDDFGSGYSSLNTLKDVPAQVVKLDMRFFGHSDDTQRGGSIISSVVRMIKWLNMSVIAEGVETKEQADFLRSIGCYYIQGYLYAKPMAKSEYGLYCTKYSARARLAAIETVENLDSNAFWDPSSMDTLIFNSYIGGACIFEFADNKVELLRVNQKYAQEIGGASMTQQEAARIDVAAYMDPSSRELFISSMHKSVDSGEETSCEVCVRGLNPQQPVSYIHCSVRAIARAGERVLLYGTVLDTTRRSIAEQLVKESAEQLSAIMNNVDSGILALAAAEDGTLRIVFANQRYYEMNGYTKEQFDREVSDIRSLIHPQDRERVEQNAAEVLKSGSRNSLEYLVLRRDGSEMYLSSNMACTRIAGVDVPVLLCAENDITEQKKNEHELIENDMHIRFLNEMSHNLLAHPDTQMGINRLLDKLIEYFKGNRAYIFEFDSTRKFVSNTYEVCAEGVTTEMAKLQNLPAEMLKIWFEAFRKDGVIAIENISKLDGSREQERQILEMQGITSLAAAPVFRGGELIGFIGVDDPQRRIEQVKKLAALGDYIAVMLTRRDLDARIKNDAQTLTEIMDDSPGAFARMKLMPDGKLSTVFVNDNLCKLRQMTREEILSVDNENAAIAMHPDDAAEAQKAIMHMLQTGETAQIVYRLLRADGSYIPQKVHGRVTKAEDGSTYVNIFYTNLSQQESFDFSVSDTAPLLLSAIMQSSTALDFAKDKDFNYICCSPAFAKLCRQESEEDVIGKNDYDLWTKEEADHFRADDTKLFESGQSLLDYTEPVPSDDGVQHYCLTSKFLLRNSAGEIIGMYGTARDITDTQEAFKRLQLLTDSLPGGIARYAVSERGFETLYFNDGICKMLGCTREEYEELARSNISEKVVAEDLPELQRQIAILCENGTPVNCTYRNYRTDGDGYIWINMRAELSERNRDICYVNAVLYDVTEMREAQQREHDYSERLNFILDNAASGIRAVTIDGDKVEPIFVNDRFYEVLGYTKEQYEAEVTDRFDVIHPEDKEWVKKEMSTARNVGDTRTMEFRCITPRGEVRWVRVGITVARFSGIEKPVQLNVHTDITLEKEQAEQRKQLLDNLPCGAGLYEYKDGQLSLVFQNKSYWNMVGLHEDALLDPTPMSAIHPDDRSSIMEALAAAIQQQHDVYCDIKLRHLKKGYIPVHLTARAMPTPTGSFLIYATFTPIDAVLADYRDLMPHILKIISESSADYTFVKNAQLRYLACSKAFLEISGLKSESEVLGKTDFDIFPKELAQQFRENDTKLLKSGRSLVDFEETVTGHDGTKHTCRASKYALRNAAEEIIGLYGVSRDITNETKMRQQLEMINNNVPGGIATYAVSPRGMEIVYYNEGFCKMLGYTKEEYDILSKTSVVSRVFEEDYPGLMVQVNALYKNGTPINYTYRTKGASEDGCIWINLRGELTQRTGDICYINAILLDVTRQQETLELLRMSEEESRFAVEHGGNAVCRYDIPKKILSLTEKQAKELGLPQVLTNVPEEPVRTGIISPDTASAYLEFFAEIQRGEKNASALYRQKYSGEWQWTHAKSSTLFSDDGRPIKAVISMFNVNEQVEKEAIYKKWQQSLAERDLSSYSMFRCNLNTGTVSPNIEGKLIYTRAQSKDNSFESRIKDYANHSVFADDREVFLSFANPDLMLAAYHRGKRTDSLVYRELTLENSYRWLKLTVELVESQTSSEIEAYMMFENVDEEKRSELERIRLAETDPLTGLSNRASLTSRVNKILTNAAPSDCFALLMLDLDGFKRVNDVFGHAAGDQTLIDIAQDLQSIFRSNDIISRFAGDEFMIFMNKVQDEKIVREKAAQICAICNKALSVEVSISGSVGVAFAPRDGVDFDTLYGKVDSALYHVKATGKNNSAVYSDRMLENQRSAGAGGPLRKLVEIRRRMLVVDDNAIQLGVLEKLFKKEYIIEVAKDGKEALTKLRHYERAISVVLLDLFMPEMDGFEVLSIMRNTDELRDIPVIIISGDETRDTCLRAIRAGATDYITKPVDAQVLGIRITAAVSRAENERLRAKNSMLELQTINNAKHRIYAESPGVCFIDYYCFNESFVYSPSVEKYLLGSYDQRKLWDILISDGVADSAQVKALKELVKRVSKEEQLQQTVVVSLKTPGGEVHRFRVSATRALEEAGQKDLLVLALVDLEY